MKMISTQIIEALNKAQQELEKPIIEGKMSSYEHYRYNIGRIHGLQHAIELCRYTINRSDND